jgi:uncharacterized repeat protein (TIGR01451 family)
MSHEVQPPPRRWGARAIGALIGAALLMGATSAAVGSHTGPPQPEATSTGGIVPFLIENDPPGGHPGGNASCEQYGLTTIGAKSDYDEDSKTFTPAIPQGLTVGVSENGIEVTWTAADTVTVRAVIVKGSNASHFYAYDGTLAEDSKLVSPPAASPSELSNLTFCGERTSKVTVIKNVINDNGGTLGAGDFGLTLTVDGVPQSFPGSATGTVFHLTPGVGFSVDEPVVPAGYEKSVGEGCAIADAQPGVEYVCTVTNDDIPARLTVIKNVINDDGGNAVPSDFTMNVSGTNVSLGTFPGTADPGTTVTLDAGPYSVDETFAPGYTKTLGADCSGSVAIGESRTCTITNNDVPTTVITRVRNPRLAIVKTGPLRARPLQRITYTIRVRNPGRAVARNVVVTDSLPSGLIYVKASRKATAKGRVVTIPMGNLRPGQARTVRIAVRAAANVRGRKLNVAIARAGNVRPVRDTAPTVFRPTVRRIIPAVTG